MSNKTTLYKVDLSAPCRSVSIVAHLIGLKLETRDLDLFAGEHMMKWFLEINPEHTVPTLVDDGKALWESHAICAYLVDKYAKDDSLYPKDLYLRARCNQRLFFADSILYVRLRAASAAIFFAGATETSKDKIDLMYNAYDLLEAMLVDDYLVGSALTIADICAMVEVTSMDEIYAPISSHKYPKISTWLGRIKKLPFYDEMNGKHVNAYKATLTHIMEANKKRVA